jgi:hypothetical protein
MWALVTLGRVDQATMGRYLLYRSQLRRLVLTAVAEAAITPIPPLDALPSAWVTY